MGGERPRDPAALTASTMDTPPILVEAGRRLGGAMKVGFMTGPGVMPLWAGSPAASLTREFVSPSYLSRLGTQDP
jgi:hypothetical protein